MKATPTSPETSPSRLPATKRREQLIEVAANLFAQKGFSGTTTREIATAAGVTEAIIFRHFETKEQLYTAIIDHHLSGPGKREWMAGLQQAMDRNDDESVIRQIVTAIIGTHRTDPQFERLMLYAALEGNHTALLYVRQVTSEIVAQFKSYLTRRRQDGVLRDIPSDTVLMAIVGMAKTYAHGRYIHGCKDESLSDDDAIQSFTRIALSGICASQDRSNK